ncbi:MAG: GTPase HflX [Nitrososphaerota archaeon]|nr:GTPase HflX [Candidatus Bathyarchaeota archaeon]MDW8061269.1 GTPase HflX [Nitrososphaerota archaeon]
MSKKAVLCMVKTNPHDHELYRFKLEELRRLAEALNYSVVGELIQVRVKPAVDYVFGWGKVVELKSIVSSTGVDTVIFYNTLTGKQKFNLERFLGRRVIDRYELTLEIFSSMASDEVSKLQIEVARLSKSFTYDRIILAEKYRIGREHPNLRSRGEYIYRNQIGSLKRRLSKLKEKMDKYLEMQKMQLEKRRSLGLPLVCITGYYNAGKTTLFNALTGLRKPVSPLPFTTLSSKYYLAQGIARRFFLVDTIGFVYDLDPMMIESFKLTLNDIVQSDLTLLVADISEREDVLRFKVETVSSILEDTLGVDESRIILVLNKVDLVDPVTLSKRLSSIADYSRRYPSVVVSASKGYNLEYLLRFVESSLESIRDTIYAKF